MREFGELLRTRCTVLSTPGGFVGRGLEGESA